MFIKTLTVPEMAELERLLIEDYRLELRIMVENAGRALARRSQEFLGGSLSGKRILVLSGKGNNGGGGIVSARHMHNWGADVTVVLAERPLRLEPAKQLSILQKMQVRIEDELTPGTSNHCDLIIDSLLGYNQRRDPRSKISTLVKFANESGSPVISLDIPTGLDPNTGHANYPCVKATQTITLALPKACFTSEEGLRFAGDIYLADISVPRSLYLHYGIHSEKLFERYSTVKLEYRKDKNCGYILAFQESQN